jgi:hypothetical protein
MPAASVSRSSTGSDPPLVFVDQSGQLGGAELFLADLAMACGPSCRVLLLEEGPFVEYLRARGVAVETVSLPDTAKQFSKGAGAATMARVAPHMVAHLRGWIGRVPGKAKGRRPS